jgi:bifunctional non-homologous end joining protein LigD
MKRIVDIAGQKLTLTNLEKVIYPLDGFTKAHVLDYYRRMSLFIVPHLRNRALTLKRYPGGVDQEYFFEKRCPAHRPPWVDTAQISQHDGEKMMVCLVNNLNTLIWVANLASIELHVPLARSDSPWRPDAIVFDLDPGEPADILLCAKVALILRETLLQVNLVSYVKTSGQKGLHVFVPLNYPGVTFEDTKQFSRAMAEVLQRNYPEMVTSKMAKENRQGKVFINWAQNDAAKTMVCVYSLRAREKPMVSFPLSWKELEDTARRGKAEMLHVSQAEALKRVERTGDLFGDILKKRQILPLSGISVRMSGKNGPSMTWN